jgi:Na+-transporting NADH:ubiquinone oxidoreductase subunit NqrC
MSFLVVCLLISVVCNVILARLVFMQGKYIQSKNKEADLLGEAMTRRCK